MSKVIWKNLIVITVPYALNQVDTLALFNAGQPISLTLPDLLVNELTTAFSTAPVGRPGRGT